jgi:WD40 repeat protein
LLITTEKGAAQEWDAEDGRLIVEIKPKKKYVHLAKRRDITMTWTPDGRRLVFNDDSGTLQLFNGVTGQLIAKLSRCGDAAHVY